MARSAQTPHVVIMGDLVHSEAAPSANELHYRFNVAVDEANAAFAKDLTSPLTITLGDEFQGLCRNLDVGLSLMRQVRWRLLKNDIQCRFVVGLVSLATPLNEVRAWNMMGPGLARAREKLGQKRDPNAYRFSFTDQPIFEALMDGVGLTLTDIETEWTKRQRDIVFASFRMAESSSVIAGRFGIAESVFYKIRRAAKFDLYSKLWSILHQAAATMDAERKP